MENEGNLRIRTLFVRPAVSAAVSLIVLVSVGSAAFAFTHVPVTTLGAPAFQPFGPSTSRLAISFAQLSLERGEGPAAVTHGALSVRTGSSGLSVERAARPDPPTPRFGASMAYDAKDGYVVLFGGWNFTSYSNQTWKFAGGIWTELSPTRHPSARFAAAMTYDAADGYVLLFGGANATAVLGDTWEFSGGQWTKLTPTTHPAARYDPGFTFDAADGYVLLFGGGTSTTFFGDTWKFVGGTWTRLTPSVHPSARGGEGLAYDAKDGYVVLYGGCNQRGFCGGSLHDTWTYLAGVWTKLSTSNHPPPASGGPVMVYDSVDGYVLMFGGSNNTTSFASTWAFSGGSWTHLTPSPHPSGRVLAAFAYDAADGYVVVFGGLRWGPPHDTFLADTWSYATGSWVRR